MYSIVLVSFQLWVVFHFVARILMYVCLCVCVCAPLWEAGGRGHVCVRSVLLLGTSVAVVEDAEARPAIAAGRAADAGLRQHLVQRGLLNGGRGDALLVSQVLQLPGQGEEEMCQIHVLNDIVVNYFAIHSCQRCPRGVVSSFESDYRSRRLASESPKALY